MLEAGRDLALEAGAALTMENLRLEEVIQRARVPRSSVYRLWPYKEEFTDDLLCYLAGPGSAFRSTGAFDPETFTIVEATVGDNRHLLGMPGGRWAILREATRLGAFRNYQALSESHAWHLHIALLATLGATRSGPARQRIARALEESQSRWRESLAGLFHHLMKTLGLRIRDPGRTVEHMALAGGLMIQGFGLRNVQVQAALDDAGTARELLNAPVPGPGIDGGTAPWSLAAFAYMALVEAFLELDPDWKPPAEPA